MFSTRHSPFSNCIMRLDPVSPLPQKQMVPGVQPRRGKQHNYIDMGLSGDHNSKSVLGAARGILSNANSERNPEPREHLQVRRFGGGKYLPARLSVRFIGCFSHVCGGCGGTTVVRRGRTSRCCTSSVFRFPPAVGVRTLRLVLQSGS